MQNAISFLFEREEIPPEVLRNIMLYCLDCYSSEGVPGKSGTSCAAMMFLSNWLNSMGNLGILPVKSRYLSGKEVYLGNESYVNDALRRGGAVVLRLFSDEWHYVLLTGEEGEHVYLFDPYYDQEGYGLDDIQIVLDYHNGISTLCKPMQNLDQLLHVCKMQSGRGFVQNIDRPSGAPSGQLRCQLDPLRFAAGQLRRRLSQLDIRKPYII